MIGSSGTYIFKLCLSSSPCLYFLFIERSSFITCSHICYLLSKSEDRLYVATKFGCWCDTDNKQLVTFRSHSCLEFIEHRTPCVISLLECLGHILVSALSRCTFERSSLLIPRNVLYRIHRPNQL